MSILAWGASVCLLSSMAFAEPSQADRDRALELFREGNRAFAAGDLHGAYDAYRDAWALHPSFDVACNLGRTEAELELHVAAAEHLDYCLHTFATSSKTGLRDAEGKFRGLFDDVRAKVGGVRMNMRPITAEVLIDGASMGSGPFERELFAAPGEHRITVRAKGYRPKEETLSVTAGSSQTLEIKLERESATPLAASAAPATTTSTAAAQPEAPTAPAHTATTPTYARPSGPEPRTIVVASGAGLTLAGLGVGVAFMLDAASAADATDALGENASACGSNAASGNCSRYQDSLDREKSSRNIANIAFLASGIVGAATAGLWLVLPERAAERVALVQPWLDARAGGVSVSGKY